MDLVYTASDTEVSDTLSFCYNEFGILKGFSRYFLGKTNWVLGDVNGDKLVNITDIMLIVNYIFGEAPVIFIKQNADFNHDGSINVSDVVSVVDVVLNNLFPPGSRQCEV